MKILVTGGAGFIGSNFIKYILKKHRNYQVINLDFLTYAGNLNNLLDIEKNKNYQFIYGDICNENLVEKILTNDVEIIVNFAAESHVDRSIDDSSIFIQTNIMGTQVLLDAAKKYGIRKFIQISTDEVYGTLGKQGYFSEKSPLAANNPYAASKAGADLLVRSYYNTYGLPVIITRSSNNYGPYQNKEKLIPLLINNAYRNKELPIYGDGLQIRDWIHVQDHCLAIDLVISQGEAGEIYNIGANNERTNLEIAQMILDYMDKPHNLIRFVSDRPGHDRRYAIDSKKIKEQLAWKSEYSFEKGLKETIDWYCYNILS